MIREVERARAVKVTDCFDRPVVEPIWLTNPDGTTVGAYSCANPDCASVHYIDPEETRQWRPSFEGIAEMVARTLSLKGPLAPVVPDRLIRAGRWKQRGIHRDLFLARGLTWRDAPTNIFKCRAILSSSRPAIIAIDRLPERSAWHSDQTLSASLRDAATIHRGKMQIDVSLLMANKSETVQHCITISQAATELLDDIDGLDFDRAKARVSVNAARGKFGTNGKRGRGLRIDLTSFKAWRLDQRKLNLERLDEEHGR